MHWNCGCVQNEILAYCLLRSKHCWRRMENVTFQTAECYIVVQKFQKFKWNIFWILCVCLKIITFVKNLSLHWEKPVKIGHSVHCVNMQELSLLIFHPYLDLYIYIYTLYFRVKENVLAEHLQYFSHFLQIYFSVEMLKNQRWYDFRFLEGQVKCIVG